MYFGKLDFKIYLNYDKFCVLSLSFRIGSSSNGWLFFKDIGEIYFGM